jgi:hypothetical protein
MNCMQRCLLTEVVAFSCNLDDTMDRNYDLLAKEPGTPNQRYVYKRVGSVFLLSCHYKRFRNPRGRSYNFLHAEESLLLILALEP